MKRTAAWLGCIAALTAGAAAAHEGDTFQPFVSYTHYYDSNLFRLAEGETTFVVENGVPVVIDKDSASDQYGIFSAGLSVDWRPGRQQILASATKNLVRYSQYSSLDYDGSDYRLGLNWRLGNRWFGRVGGSENVTQTSFTELALSGVLEAINNQVTRETRYANAEWQYHPRWSVGAGLDTASATNSTTQQAPADYEDQTVSVYLAYTTPKGSRLSGHVSRLDGEFPNRLTGETEYEQKEINIQGDWNLAGKLSTRFKLGHVRRESDNTQDGYSNFAGRVSADYRASGKTLVNWAIYRELVNSDDVNASSQINTGTSMGLVWGASGKLSLRAGASFENRSYRDDAGLGQRDEETLSGSLSLSYAPIQAATIDIGFQAGRRDSDTNVVTTNDYSYTFHAFYLSVRGQF